MDYQLTDWVSDARGSARDARGIAKARMLACFSAAQCDPSSAAARTLDLSGLSDLGRLPECIGELTHLRNLNLKGVCLCLPTLDRLLAAFDNAVRSPAQHAPFTPTELLNAPFTNPVSGPRRDAIIGALQTLHTDPEQQRSFEALDLHVERPFPLAPERQLSAADTAAIMARATEVGNAEGVAYVPDRLDTAMIQSPQFQAMWCAATKLFDELHAMNLGGKNADYIRALEDQDITKVGFSIVTADGGQRSHGDGAYHPVSIQSTSKLLDYLLARRAVGGDGIDDFVDALYSPLSFKTPTTVGLATSASAGDDKRPGTLANTLLTMRCPETTLALRELIEKCWPDRRQQRPANAMQNFGAIATAAQIPSGVAVKRNEGDGICTRVDADLGTLGRFYNTLALIKRMGRPQQQENDGNHERKPFVRLDHAVFGSERTDSAGNETLARLAALHAAGQPVATLGADAQRAIMAEACSANDIYTANCSLQTHAAYWSSLMACLANGGRNVFTDEQVIPREDVNAVCRQMLVGGLYEASNDFNRDTGMIGKSGVGGLVAVIEPNSGMAITTMSSRLGPDGNSGLGMAFLRKLSKLPEYQTFRAYAAARGSAPEAVAKSTAIGDSDSDKRKLASDADVSKAKRQRTFENDATDQ